MNRYTSLRLIITLALVLLFSSACGTRRLTATSNVEGTVTVDGRPGGVGIPVRLTPLGIITTTDANGRFAFEIKMGDLEPDRVYILEGAVIVVDEWCDGIIYFQPRVVIDKGGTLDLELKCGEPVPIPDWSP